MKSRFQTLLSVIMFSIVAVSANPIMPVIISEVQVTQPSQWKIELSRLVLPSCGATDSCTTDAVTLRTSRYPDTFHLRLALTKTQSFAIVSPESIIGPVPLHAVEMQKGDTVYIAVSGTTTIFTDKVLISYVGSDSSMCLCSQNYFTMTNTPTLGASNIFPTNQIAVYILSRTDSMPIVNSMPALGLYIQGMGVCPVLYTNLRATPLMVNPSSCGGVNYWIMDRSCGPTYGKIVYNYNPGALSHSDTIFITPPVEVNKSNYLRKELSVVSLSVLKTTSSFVFIINNNRDFKGSAQLYITTATGRMVKDFSIRLAGSGTYSIHWDNTNFRGRNLNDGVYFAALSLNGQTASKKFVVSGSRRLNEK